MLKYELELEHKFKNRFVGKLRLKSSKPTTLGSSPQADILLAGEEVGGLHALIERQGGVWKILDLGSKQGTWVEKEPIVEQTINGLTVVTIGNHTLKMTPLISRPQLFLPKVKSEKKEVLKGAEEFFHQVIIRKNGFIQETHLLSPQESFQWSKTGKVQQLAPPQGVDWIMHDFEPYVVQQRLINCSENQSFRTDKTKEPIDSSLRMSLLISGTLGLIIAAFISFELKKPADSKPVQPDMNNFTKMIFDAKTLKSKREQATKATKTLVGQSKSLGSEEQQQKAPSPNAPKPAVSQAAAKVVTKIRSSGLSQLIGKISQRAAQTNQYIVSTGRTPNSVPTGMALGVAGSAAIKKGAQVGTESYHVGGVATSGKGGGSSAYKGVGGLSIGNVGNATVGVLEEETEIEGGLDKEVIANVIKSQLGQIRYCYERQLSASPDLYGKVQIRFTISPGGEVTSQSVGSTTLNNAMVEGCILRRIAGWKFPKPKGGTAVVVTYPFLFKSVN